MKVRCHTNLDLSGEKWPTELPAVPNVGDHIVSSVVRKGFSLELQVVRVTWKRAENFTNYGESMEYIPHIELHMTDWQRKLQPIYADHVRQEERTAAVGSIRAFYDWYAPLVGRTTSAFI